MNKSRYLIIKDLHLLKMCFRLQHLEEKKNQIFNNIKGIEEKICEENNELEKYRSDRNKYQQNIQQIEALKGRIKIAESSIKKMEEERKSIDNIKAECTKEIKVFFYLKSLCFTFRILYILEICIYF